MPSASGLWRPGPGRRRAGFHRRRDPAGLPPYVYGNSQQTAVDAIVYVDPVKYYRMPYYEKAKVARIIGSVNWHYRDSGKKLLLMVPGRIGTSSPELGVPTIFSDISGFCAIFELAESKAGYRRSFPTEAIFFRIWWKMRSCIRRYLKTAGRQYSIRTV